MPRVPDWSRYIELQGFNNGDVFRVERWHVPVKEKNMESRKRVVILLLFSVLLAFQGGPLTASVLWQVEADTTLQVKDQKKHKPKKERKEDKKRKDVEPVPENRVAAVRDSNLLGSSPQSPEPFTEGPEAESPAPSQGILVDGVVAVIGTKMVKLSDVEHSVENMRLSGLPMTENSRCEALESLMISNLYELQADEDSVSVSDAEVEQELEARIRYFINQIGSREKLEEFYGKTVVQIKEEYREMIRANIVAMKMESQITADVKVTPSEVKRFFNALPKDSIPLVPLKYELLYITQKPVISLSEREIARQRLTEIRDRIEKGEQFRSLAALYSQDPGSARRGGDLGYGARGDWASEFESMAFSLPIGELSPVFETQFGFHILEVLDRRGEMAHVRHILIRPEASTLDLMRAQMELDSVAQLIRNGVYTMKDAVGLFSDDAGVQGDGVYLSPMTRQPSYTSEELEPVVFLAVQDLDEGMVTNALPYTTEDNQPAFRLFYVKRRTPPHRANMETDYDLIYEMALQKAKTETMQKWMSDKIGDTYVRIMEGFKDCKFMYQWRSL